MTHRRALACAAAIAALAAMLALAPGARAGGWTLVSCTQPNGQAAPTDQWSPGLWAGGPVAGSGALDSCATGGTLTAVSSAAVAVSSYTGPEWIFTAPDNSRIVGGTVSASITAPQGQAWIGTPQPAYDVPDVIANCEIGYPCGAAGTNVGVFPITHPGGDKLYAPALCNAGPGAACPVGITGAVNAEVNIKAADIQLSTDATPVADGFAGSVFNQRVGGKATLRMRASDPGGDGGFGPGVYRATIQIDGKTVYSGVPDDHHGRCVPLGTDAATGGLMFDHAQPCAPAEAIAVPVDTSNLSDGRHTLTAQLTDAAGDVATVLHRTIETFNPILTPEPRPGVVATRLRVGFHFGGQYTSFASITARGLPASGHVSARCLGKDCPKIHPARVGVAHADRLWHALSKRRFTAGQRVRIIVTAPHRHPLRLQLTMRAGRVPGRRLL